MVQTSSAGREALSERELDILDALAEGLSNQEIASRLYIALTTVKWYNTQIFTKLGVANRQEAVEAAQRLALRSRVRAPETIPNNLPAQVTPFVGRKQEVAELNALLARPDVRLITILGPGGMGKTRLGLQIAEMQLARFADGVFLARLAALESAGGVPEAIARLFQLHHYEGGQDGLAESIARYLRTKAMLLILDNFEHLSEDVPTVAAILQNAPDVKIVVTSRERLNMPGEHVYLLKGMAVPQTSRPAQDDGDALQLFLQVVQRTQFSYQPRESDWKHLVRICQLVGGMPLALELAAGWMDTLPPERIADEISACIDILETDMREVPERHRSIRATFDQTWTRLSDAERHVLMSASVFRGGFTREAAEEVAGATVHTLRHLTGRALLYRSNDDRFDLHELVRQYGEEKLRASGQYEAAIERYINYFVSVCDGKSNVFFDLVEHDTIRRCIADTDNIVAAWRHALARARLDVLSRLRPAMRDTLSMGGHSHEQHALFSETADAIVAADFDDPAWDLLHAALRADIANISLGILPHEESHVLAEEAVRLLEPFGATDALCDAYLTLSCDPFNAVSSRARHRLSAALRALEVAEQAGSLSNQLRALCVLAEFQLDAEDRQAASGTLERLWTLMPTPGDRARLPVWMLRLTARLQTLDGQYDEAIHSWDHTLELLLGFRWFYYESSVRTSLAELHLAHGNVAEAKEQHRAILLLHKEHARDWQMLGALLGCFAHHFLMKTGEYVYAAEILSFVHHHAVAPRKYVVHTAHLLDEVHEQLSDADYSEAVERGRHMKLAQVVEDALAYLSA